MPRMRLNFTGVGEGLEPLPKGIYPATVFVAEPGKAKSSGKPMVSVTFNVTEPKELANRKAWTILSLQPQSMWRVREFLVTIGYDKEDLKGEFDIDWNDILGLSCRIQIGHEMYEGTLRQRTVKVLPPSDEGFQALEEVDLGMDVDEV